MALIGKFITQAEPVKSLFHSPAETNINGASGSASFESNFINVQFKRTKLTVIVQCNFDLQVAPYAVTDVWLKTINPSFVATNLGWIKMSGQFNSGGSNIFGVQLFDWDGANSTVWINNKIANLAILAENPDYFYPINVIGIGIYFSVALVLPQTISLSIIQSEV